MDVNDYSSDAKVRKALRSLCCHGTSLGVAQAVMWRVCNNLPFETMAAEAGGVMNAHEIALAARFVEALDGSGEGELVDASDLTEGRILVHLQSEGLPPKDARRLEDQLERSRLCGLPVKIHDGEEPPTASAPALFFRVLISSGKAGDVRGRIAVSRCAVPGEWVPLGKAAFQENVSITVLDGEALSQAVERAIAAAFVSVKPTRRTPGSTTLKIENHLPFTLAGLTLKAGNSAGAPNVQYEAVGIGPGRSALLPIQAAGAVIERVQLNGL
jgi:hypothetical protein